MVEREGSKVEGAGSRPAGQRRRRSTRQRISRVWAATVVGNDGYERRRWAWEVAAASSGAGCGETREEEECGTHH
jgi:hypothetical protein